MTVYLCNVNGRNHRDLYSRATDGPLVPFFDLERSGPQADMVPSIARGTECIVATYYAPDRTKVVFSHYSFFDFDTRPTNEEPNGRKYRVFLGTSLGQPTDPVPKSHAAEIDRYTQFFNRLGNFKGISAFQR